MCHFLTLSVPGAAVPDVPPTSQGALSFHRHDNPSVTKHAPAGWTSFTVTKGGCSCGLYRSGRGDDRERQAEKYRKKGWSEAKIRRALDDRGSTREEAGLRADVLEIVATLVRAQQRVRVALHWYGGDVEREVFELADGGSCSLAELQADPTRVRDETSVEIRTAQRRTASEKFLRGRSCSSGDRI